MSTPTMKTLVNRLRELKAADERLQRRRDRTPQRVPFVEPNEAHRKINAEKNRIAGEIMHTERCIINKALQTFK